MWCYRRVVLGLVLGVTTLSVAASETDMAALKKAVEARAAEFAKTAPPLPEGRGRQSLDAPSASAEDVAGMAKASRERGWQQLMGRQDQSWLKAERPPETPPAEQPDAYVFISLSMPETVLKALFRSVAYGETNKRTVFVVRGWEPPHFRRTISQISRLFPQDKNVDQVPAVQFHPGLYRDMAVDTVPTILIRKPNGNWRRFIGDTSLEVAKQMAAQPDDKQVKVGNVWPIQEPDIINVMKAKAAAYDWEKAKRDAIDRAWKRNLGVDLPAVAQSSERIVDPTITLKQDIKDPKGQVVAEAGQSVNPLMYARLSRAYVFFDASQKTQVQQAVAWKNTGRPLTYIAQHLPDNEPERVALSELLDAPVYEVNQQLVNRFQLKALPVLVEQAGNKLLITEKKVQQ